MFSPTSVKMISTGLLSDTMSGFVIFTLTFEAECIADDLKSILEFLISYLANSFTPEQPDIASTPSRSNSFMVLEGFIMENFPLYSGMGDFVP